MATHGIKVSKPGFNVLTAGINDLAFHSDFQQLKIIFTGLANIHFNSGESDIKSVTIAHGLGYKPAYYGFMYKPDNGLWYAFDDFGVYDSGALVYQILSYADENNLYFFIYKAASPLNATDNTIRYFVFTEEIYA